MLNIFITVEGDESLQRLGIVKTSIARFCGYHVCKANSSMSNFENREKPENPEKNISEPE